LAVGADAALETAMEALRYAEEGRAPTKLSTGAFTTRKKSSTRSRK
jgi:hypothetical protein